jgi:hypothetical protein
MVKFLFYKTGDKIHTVLAKFDSILLIFTVFYRSLLIFKKMLFIAHFII